MSIFRRLARFIPSQTIDGYDHPELTDTIFRKTVAYQPSAPFLDMLETSTVLDFGGGCGRHYKEAALASPNVRWAVVETPAMVARAKEIETDFLRFFTSIDAAQKWLGTTQVVHSNGALQYVPDPVGTARQICDVGAERLFWFRLFTGDGNSQLQTSLLSDNGPGYIPVDHKRITYLRTAVSEARFLDAHYKYRLTARGSDWFHFSR